MYVKIRNETILERMGISKAIMDYIEETQISWYGNVQRMSEERLRKNIMRGISSENGKKGRAKKS